MRIDIIKVQTKKGVEIKQLRDLIRDKENKSRPFFSCSSSDASN